MAFSLRSRSLRLALYGRTASADRSTDQQIAHLEAWAREAGHTVVDAHWDRGDPGTTCERAGLAALFAGLQKAAAEAVAVRRLDRLASSPSALLGVLRRIRESNVQLLVQLDRIDTSALGGHMFWALFGALCLPSGEAAHAVEQ